MAGIITGDIYTGAGNDTVTISAATTYNFSHVLDGGVGNDQLTLSGQTMNGQAITTTADRFTNWEGLTLQDGTKLNLGGTVTLDMGLSVDAGSVFLSVQDGATGDVIRINGDYTGSEESVGVFALDAVIDGDASSVDKLVITGKASGDMMLSIAGLDSVGAAGAPLEIDVVSVGEASDGTFILVDGNHVTSDGEHAVIAGAYLYRLAEAQDGGGWALSALSETGETVWQASAPLYDSYSQSLLALNGLSSLRKRGSSQDFRSMAWGGGPAAATQSGAAAQDTGSPLWIQMGTEQITSSAEHSTTGAALESDIWEMEIGADLILDNSAAGLLVGGLMLSYATGSTVVSSSFGDGSIETSGLGLGVAATWHDARRFYIDGQATWTSYASDLTSDSLGTLTEGNSGTGYALSIEAGQQFDLGTGMTVIPQAQLSLSSVAFTDFASEARREQVALSDAASQQLRLGLEFGGQGPEARRLYGIVNLFHEFGAGSAVDVAGASLTTESEPWAVGVGLGGNYAWNDRVDLFGEASYATGLSTAGDTSALGVNAGLKVMF